MNLVVNVLVYQFVDIISLCDKPNAYQFVPIILMFRPQAPIRMLQLVQFKISSNAYLFILYVRLSR